MEFSTLSQIHIDDLVTPIYYPTTMQEEIVVLVDEDNNVLGTTPKATVHGPNTPLHRAFSSFIFNSRGEILLQQRAKSKKTWPLVWSNTCCGHPGLDESNRDAAIRRLQDELGMNVDIIEEVAPYRYTFTRFGIMENENCPILVGFSDSEPVLNPDEVESTQWMPWEEFVKETEHNENLKWSEWCVEEVQILLQNERFQELWNTHVQ